MLSRPDERTLKAIAALTELGDTDLLLQWLAGERERARDIVESSNEEISLRRAQGLAIGLGELIGVFKTARENLQKMKEQQRKQ